MSKELSVTDKNGNLIGYNAETNKSKSPQQVRIIVITGIFPITSIKPARLSFFYFDLDYTRHIVSRLPYMFYGKDEKQIKDIKTLLNINKTQLNTITGDYIKKNWEDWLITPIYDKDKIKKFLKVI